MAVATEDRLEAMLARLKLSAIRERRGMTVVVVTYDSAVAQHADRVLHMRDGRLVPEDDALVATPATA